MNEKLQAAILEVNKRFGKGSVLAMNESKAADDIEVIPSGIEALDALTGVGGIPRGRITEIFGPECLYENTFIQYTTVVNGRRSNHKGGTIKRLYERFHKLPSSGDGRGKYAREVTQDAVFYAPSINELGRIVQNKIKNVVYAGEKECWAIVANGYEILASKDHKLLTKSNGYCALEDLVEGDYIMLHLNTPFKTTNPANSNKNRIDLYVKAHPIAGTKIIKQGENRYYYKRLARARAVIEAEMNNLSLDAYVDRLNIENLKDLKFLDREQEVHHIDENEANDVLSNLKVLTSEEHSRLHALDRHNNLRFTVTPHKITEKRFIGMLETYDIQMESPYNNFIANKFAVHNSSGKTTLCLQIIAQAQQMGGQVAYIDAEQALNTEHAASLGVNVDELLIAQPMCGEEGLEIAHTLMSSGAVMAIVIDSVDALVPRAELEGDFGDSMMGVKGRMMGQAMRKMNATVASTGTSLIFINQLRDKLGVMFGSPETTTGGKSLKFYASLRLDIRRISQIKKGDTIIGANTKIKTAKNKMAPPLRDCEVKLIYGRGLTND